jgi:hypothetical protein
MTTFRMCEKCWMNCHVTFDAFVFQRVFYNFLYYCVLLGCTDHFADFAENVYSYRYTLRYSIYFLVDL